MFIQVHLKKFEYGEKVKVKCKVKHFKRYLFFILMIRAYSSSKSKISISKYYNINIWVSINDHPYSINSITCNLCNHLCSSLWFFETTMMGNTAGLVMVQKTIIDTFHKEDKSQRVITERGGCSRSAVSKHIKCKVDWKEEMLKKWKEKEKVHKQQGFKHLGELHKEWTEAGVSTSRVTMEKGYQATSETETSSAASYLG